MSEKIYRINWSTREIETATLLDRRYMNEGASVESWLCKDSSGRRFTCSKGSWHFSEKAAWEEYSYDVENSAESMFLELKKVGKEYERLTNESLRAKQKVLSLTTKQ